MRLNGQMSVASAVRGVVFRPHETFAALRQTPKWLGAMVLVTTVSAGSWAAFYATDRGRIALVDQWERTSFAMGRGVDDTGYARLQQLSRRGVEYAVGRALLLGPLLTVAVAGLVLLASRRLSGGVSRPTFQQCLAVAAHAAVVLALRDLVAVPVAFVRETTASATTLGRWFPLLDESSTAARFLGSLDGFALWWVALVGIGTAILCQRSARRTAAVALGTFAVGAGVMAGVLGLVGGGG